MSRKCLIVHVSQLDGTVILRREDGTIEYTRESVASFLRAFRPDKGTLVRILGTRGVCPIIREWSPNSRAKQFRVEIASPRLLGQLKGISDEAIVESIAQIKKGSPSTGFWRVVTELDIRMAEISMAADDEDLMLVEDLVLQHPLWPVASFVVGLTPLNLGLWMSEVFDPRWFVNHNKPDRTSGLETYLGLIPAVQARLLAQRESPKDGVDLRCHLTQQCWFMPQGHESLSPQGMRDPRNFIQRAMGLVPAEKPNYVAVLYGSRVFVTFIRQIWTSLLAGPRVEALFEPSLFFRTVTEVEAFRRFAQSPTPGWNSEA